MKIKGEKNCKAIFRNLPGDDSFHLRLEYQKPTVSLYYFDKEKDDFKKCASVDFEMDFSGIFMITGASGLNNPDHIYIDNFAMYDPTERVSESHNQHFHDAHLKKSIHDMVIFDHEHHLKDLLHSSESFFNKDLFGEDNLLNMIPD